MPKEYVGWTYFGKGNYNFAYHNADKSRVLKVLNHDEDYYDETDFPERSVRLWNEINPHLEAAELIILEDGTQAWTCPFIHGVQASDKEMQQAVLDIYSRTGRIVLDALTRKNVLKTPANNLICVDIGLALLLEPEPRDLSSPPTLSRKKSKVSIDAWSLLSEDFHKMYTKYHLSSPQTVNTLKTLLLLKEFNPDFREVMGLTPSMIDMCAKKYDLFQKSQKNSIPFPSAWVHETLEMCTSLRDISDDGAARASTSHHSFFYHGMSSWDELKNDLLLTMQGSLSLFILNKTLGTDIAAAQNLLNQISNASSPENAEQILDKFEHEGSSQHFMKEKEKLKQYFLHQCKHLCMSSSATAPALKT